MPNFFAFCRAGSSSSPWPMSAVLACEIDAIGRGDGAARPYPQAQVIRDTLVACQSVQIEAIVARGGDGNAIKTALRAARSAAVRGALNRQ